MLLFELETSVLDDRRIRGAVKISLHWVRIICYVAVYYAFTGYYAELSMLYDVTPLSGFDACASVSEGRGRGGALGAVRSCLCLAG